MISPGALIVIVLLHGSDGLSSQFNISTKAVSFEAAFFFYAVRSVLRFGTVETPE